MTTSENLVGVAAQYNEIINRVGMGRLEADTVRRAFQEIVENRAVLSSGYPASWTSIENQNKQLRVVSPRDIPAVWFYSPHSSLFKPHTDTALPLLVLVLPAGNGMSSLTRTCKFYVKLIKQRMEKNGHTFDARNIKFDRKHLRSISERKLTPGLKVVSFDPHANRPDVYGRYADGPCDRSKLAGIEVLAALALTDYGVTMNGQDRPFMSLGALRSKDDKETSMEYEWFNGLEFRWRPETRQLQLYTCTLWDTDCRWSEPSVEECWSN